MSGTARILVVEDEVLIRMLAVDMLLDLGREADEAGTAAEALQKLNAADADYGLIFMDIGLPDKRGDELILDIRKTHPNIPLLIASGEDPNELKARLQAFAPIAFLGKPYDFERLKSALGNTPVKPAG